MGFVREVVGFGEYRFDAASGRLWSGEDELKLTPKSASVLRVLINHAGEPVAKEDLFRLAWPDASVSDDALTTCIQELRRALADDARQPRFIETRHRRGYRFVAPLVEPPHEAASSASLPVMAVAVLPFADMSPNRDHGYLCDGLADELINALAALEGLRVVSRTASFQFRDVGADVQAIGRRLGAGSLVEGSLRRVDDRLRVTVQLIEVSTGYRRWSRRFDRGCDDVFAIQDEIAASVATSLRGSMLSESEKQVIARPQTRAEAYDYYLRGRQHLPRVTLTDQERSRELFSRAVAIDSEYAPALAGLAIAHATLFDWFGHQPEHLVQAEQASARALALAPELSEAHVARGLVLSIAGQFDEASRLFERAIALNSQLFEAFYYFARTSFASGDLARSAELFRVATDLRREDFQSPLLLSQSLRMLGRVEDARAALREGIRRAEHILTLNTLDSRALSLGACALGRDGQLDRAVTWASRSLELSPDDLSVLYNGACVFAKVGRRDQALDLLGRLFGRGWGKRRWVEQDSDFDDLRDDPRFLELFAALR